MQQFLEEDSSQLNQKNENSIQQLLNPYLFQLIKEEEIQVKKNVYLDYLYFSPVTGKPKNEIVKIYLTNKLSNQSLKTLIQSNQKFMNQRTFKLQGYFKRIKNLKQYRKIRQEWSKNYIFGAKIKRQQEQETKQ
ncbi:unnamed protein product (macronuclear) [Paramecium tetraurelia]|uniref:Uncharacterized protein n=1 Tax=Paramecium tetraurelia TaxID=5888 RepID=A0D6P1_PARTE|nr:uncharacterized protein GSPATT00001749001 [Paramecium tetraurelia]CAK78708.1 unnamed protein product [Paramecium tetraurelia]|eukprot:XP_001446105.1 hypothetical protein (macronuclear) [Paramecium tetraurelia strain d4-2]